jgi:hypothetical protein
MTPASRPELTAARRALAELHKAVAGLAPGLSWRPIDWIVQTTRLQMRLGHLPRVLRALRASPALDLRACQAVARLEAGPLPALTAALVRLLDRRTTPAAFADLAARWPLVANDLLDALEELVGLLQGTEEPA